MKMRSIVKSLRENRVRLILATLLVAGVSLGILPPEALAAGMLLTVTTAAGTTISISAAAPTTYDLAGYESSNLIFTPIGEIVDGGEHGRTYAEVKHQPIGSRGTQKFKGSFDEGNKTLQLGRDSDDAGQILAQTALDSDNDYSFRVIYPNGDKDYFRAKVMKFTRATPGVDSIVGATIELALTTTSAGVGIVQYNAP